MRQVLLVTDASACLREEITTYAFWGKNAELQRQRLDKHMRQIFRQKNALAGQ